MLGSLGQFFARIRALQTEGAARIVSSPQVVTLSNVEAMFDNTSTFFVRVAGREQVDLFNVSAGTTLRVTPHVFRDHDQTRIKLLVNVEDGNITNRQVDQIPVVERSTVNTQALIAEGESLLIGGMVRETQTNSEDKVPGLGDVPVVGNLFKTKSSGTTRVERMFLITPRMAGTRPADTASHARHAAQRPDTGDAGRPGQPVPTRPRPPMPGLQTSAPPVATAPDPRGRRRRRLPHRSRAGRHRAAEPRLGGGRPRRDARRSRGTRRQPPTAPARRAQRRADPCQHLANQLTNAHQERPSMDRAAPSIESLHALELRVLEGPQGGARAPLSAGVPCVLAAGRRQRWRRHRAARRQAAAGARARVRPT